MTDAIKFTVEKQAKSQVTPVVATDEGSKEKEAAAEAKQAENMASFEESTNFSLNAKTMAEAVKKSYSDEETMQEDDNPEISLGACACGNGPEKLLDRPVNEGFSGGKKRNVFSKKTASIEI